LPIELSFDLISQFPVNTRIPHVCCNVEAAGSCHDISLSGREGETARSACGVQRHVGLRHSNLEVRGGAGVLQGAGPLPSARHTQHLLSAAHLREIHQQKLV